MKYLRLLRLAVESFKGLETAEITPNGGNAEVRGSNGVGKTTIFDAYTWLLFGKDSSGRSDSSFDVKPYGAVNPTVTVSGTFAVEDGTLTLTRQLIEKTVSKRGTDETNIKNEYKFFINDVPKTKTQYDSFIADLCPQEYFRLVSDPDFFAGKMAWADRRAVLIQLFGSYDEHELLGMSERWDAIRSAVGSMSVSDFHAKTAAERKKVKDELNSIPVKIDEAKRAIPDSVEPFDPAAFKAAEEAAAKAEDDLRNAANGEAAAELRKNIAEAQAELAAAKAAYINAQADAAFDSERQSIEMQINELHRQKLQSVSRRAQIESDIMRAEAERNRLRAEWQDISAMVWNAVEEVCPCCGQQLPQERIRELRDKFNEDKSRKLEANVAAGKAKVKALADLAEEKGMLDSDVELYTARSEVARVQLEEYAAKRITPPPFEQTEVYRTGAEKIEQLRADLGKATAQNDAVCAEFKAQAEACVAKLEHLRELASQQNTVRRQTERIEELKRQGTELGKRAAQLDQLLDAAAAFEQYKLSAVEDRINSRFAYAKFRLFDRQLNGGYSECCEVVVDGAPYSTNLNPGKKINAGLDIINTLSSVIGFAAPIWVDNAESYVKLLDTESQLIAMYVDGNEPKLTVLYTVD